MFDLLTDFLHQPQQLVTSVGGLIVFGAAAALAGTFLMDVVIGLRIRFRRRGRRPDPGAAGSGGFEGSSW